MKTQIDNKTLTTQDINEILDEHKRFIAKLGGKKADFSKCNLSGYRFINQKLSSVSFAYADITNCEFIECELYNADFQLCLGEDVTFINCDAELTHFNQAQVIDSHLQDCTFLGANFNDADILNSIICDCDLSETTLLNTRLKGTKLHNIDMFKMIGNGVNLISLQLGDAMCIYSSDMMQIDDIALTKDDWKTFYLQNKDDKSLIKLVEIIPLLLLIMTTFPAEPTVTVTQ